MHQFRPPGDNECGTTLPLPVPFDSVPNDSQWWEGHWEHDEVVDYCWGDAIDKIKLKEIDGGAFDLTIGKKINDELSLRLTQAKPLIVHGKRLKPNSRINNDITTNQPFAVTLDVNKTKTLWVEGDPYLIGRKEQRPLALDILRGSHASMRVRSSFEETDDIVNIKSQVKRISKSSITLREGRDQLTLEPGIKLKGRNFLTIGSLKVEGLASEIPDGDVDRIIAPQQIKGGGELLVQGFGEEDIIQLDGINHSYLELESDKDLIPNWLLIENINWFNWME